MNLTAKIFVILILIVSLAFMFIQMTVFALRENHKRRWDADTAELIEANKLTVKSLQDATAKQHQAGLERTTALNEKIAVEDKLRGVQTELQAKLAELDRALKDAKDKEAFIAQLNNTIASKESTIANLNKRITELNSIALVARQVAHALSTKITEVEDDLNTALSSITRKDAALAEQELRIRRQDAQLAQLQKAVPEVFGEIIKGGSAAPFVEGIVAGIGLDPRGKQQFVVITVGSKDGAQLGQQLLLANRAQYICKVRVMKLDGAMAFCQVVEDSWNTNGAPITMGDRAVSHF